MWEEMELDPGFLKRDEIRKAGRPVEIARTKRLLIRETILEDVPELYRICQEDGIRGWVKPLQPTLEEELDFMRAYISHAYPFYDFGLWTVLDRSSGQVIGRAGLSVSELLDDAVELGYLIDPVRQRQGYAKECGQAILAYARDVLDMEKLHLLTDCRNEASLRTAAALGFMEMERLKRDGAELVHLVWSAASFANF